ncbi:MAG: PIN domain-containing protein [Acidobacteriota bacterium]
MSGFQDALDGVSSLGIDTAPIIYYVEANPRYDALVTEVFTRMDSGMLKGVTSVVSLAEVLVHPIRRGDLRLAGEYRDLLLNSQNFQVLSVDPDTAEIAARIRAEHNLRLPDALQFAVAIEGRCQAFLTNDPLLKRVTEIRVLALDDFLAP